VLAISVITFLSRTGFAALTSTQGPTFWDQLVQSMEVKIVGAVAGVVSFMLSLSSFFYRADETRGKRQKERIRILDTFAPIGDTFDLFSNRSIYHAAISLLRDVHDNAGRSRRTYKVSILVCSPALDYPNNALSESNGKQLWGKEFADELEKLIAGENVKLDIAYLPVDSKTGFKPMKDFLQVLANYISERSSSTFEDNLKMLEARTDFINQYLLRKQSEANAKITLHVDKLDVPFQLLLAKGPGIRECVVSFSSREILESENPDPAGFYSSDPFVVETFSRIYDDYVKENKRSTFVPIHTLEIRKRHSSVGRHTIANFLDLVPEIVVETQTFSPAIANSTKFTGWIVSKTLERTDTAVLDIGSGTGALALVAWYAMSTSDKSAWALEADSRVFENLKMNCNGTGVKPRNWKLVEGDATTSSCLLDCAKHPEQEVDLSNERDFGPFDLIIADLPYVDANEEPQDLRFIDQGHRMQTALLSWVAKRGMILKHGGRLITSFSSLGGREDIASFESRIVQSGLTIIHRSDFHEAGYLWLVYVLIKDQQNDPELKSYWWRKLKAEIAPT
jgi:precorrin-6B methylase 2